MLIAPLLVFVAMMSWALASPVGSGPDDDFHLVSTWCSSPISAEVCLPGKDSETRVVPETLVEAPCFAQKPEVSAACQERLDFTAEPSTMTNRGNFVGAYPPVYYSVMGLFASHDIESSVLAMRTVTVLIFTTLITSLYLLLPIARRPAMVWSWVLTTVPLGLFILTSNNPSAWTIMGVGFGWIALLGYYETDATKSAIGRKVALGAIFALCAFMAAGSRGDGAIYTIVAIVAVGILTFERSRRFLLESILPLAAAIMCVSMYRFSRPIETVTGGVSAEPTNFVAAVVNNLLQVPSLWMGVVGKQWGLGWLDTTMPATIWFVGLACFIGVGFVSVQGASVRRIVVLAGGALVLALLPAGLLAAAGDGVGENLQPRYILPLMVLFAGIVTLSSGRLSNRLTTPQWIMVAAGLSGSQLIALHLNMQRYVAGISNQSLNIDDHVEWWWHLALSPNTVWVIGSVAYTALIFIVLHALRRPSGIEPRENSDASEAAVLHG